MQISNKPQGSPSSKLVDTSAALGTYAEVLGAICIEQRQLKSVTIQHITSSQPDLISNNMTGREVEIHLCRHYGTPDGQLAFRTSGCQSEGKTMSPSSAHAQYTCQTVNNQRQRELPLCRLNNWLVLAVSAKGDERIGPRSNENSRNCTDESIEPMRPTCASSRFGPGSAGRRR